MIFVLFGKSFSKVNLKLLQADMSSLISAEKIYKSSEICVTTNKAMGYTQYDAILFWTSRPLEIDYDDPFPEKCQSLIICSKYPQIANLIQLKIADYGRIGWFNCDLRAALNLRRQIDHVVGAITCGEFGEIIANDLAFLQGTDKLIIMEARGNEDITKKILKMVKTAKLQNIEQKIIIRAGTLPSRLSIQIASHPPTNNEMGVTGYVRRLEKKYKRSMPIAIQNICISHYQNKSVIEIERKSSKPLQFGMNVIYI